MNPKRNTPRHIIIKLPKIKDKERILKEPRGRERVAYKGVPIKLSAGQPELTENQMARKSDTKEIKNKHSSRPVGRAETGTGVESTCVAVAGPRLAECGTNGAGSPSNSRPCGPTFAQINPEGRAQSGGEQGRQSSG